MAYKEPEFTKEGARALMQVLGGSNEKVAKRHKATAKKTRTAKRKK